MVNSLTGAYTAVDLIAFAQGHAMTSLNLEACHDAASLIPLASESQNAARDDFRECLHDLRSFVMRQAAITVPHP
jgi:hypothetical protein